MDGGRETGDGGRRIDGGRWTVDGCRRLRPKPRRQMNSGEQGA